MLVCDGKFDLTASSDSSTVFIWSTNRFFNPQYLTVPHFADTINGNRKFYVKAGFGEQCAALDSITVSNKALKLSYKDAYILVLRFYSNCYSKFEY